MKSIEQLNTAHHNTHIDTYILLAYENAIDTFFFPIVQPKKWEKIYRKKMKSE